MGKGDVEHLLPAIPEAQPVDPARAEGDERLPLLEARAFLVLLEVQEGRYPRDTLLHVEGYE